MILTKKINTLKRKINIAQYNKSNANIILFLIPYSNVINGGHLSFSSLINIFKNKKHLHNSEVIASYLLLNNTPNNTKFTEFKSNVFIQDLRTIFSHFNSFNNLTIHIPESYIHFWIDEMVKTSYPKYIIDKIVGAKNLTINILNQNDEYMDDIKYLDWIRQNLTTNITMTMAHKQYTTPEKREEYDVPIHHLSAWLNSKPYTKVSFNDKENIIILSPDDFREETEYSKADFIKYLKQSLPDFKVIEINNFKYEDYKKIIQKAKFTITFGEGLDGYLIESSFYGGVAFSVYNDIFFSKNYEKLSTLYKNLDQLIKNIVHDINKLNNFESFSIKNKELLGEIEKEYSHTLFEKRVENYLKNQFDLP